MAATGLLGRESTGFAAQGGLDALVAQTFNVYDGGDAHCEFVSDSRQGRIVLTFCGLSLVVSGSRPEGSGQ